METNEELKALEKDIKTRYKGLDSPEVMTDDIGHEEIALSYLINNKGLTQSEALNIIETVNIFDYAYEGLYVWNFYENGFYGSFITKGEADKTPNEIKKLAKRAFKARINALLSEKQKLTEKIEQLEAEKNQHMEVINNNNDEQINVEKLNKNDIKTEERYEVKKDNNKKINSLNYKLLSYEYALSKGIITESMWDGVKLSRSTGIDYSNKIEFSVTNKLILSPQKFGLSKFTEVFVFPKSLVASGNIKIVTLDKQCKIEFSNLSNLAQENILIIAK